MNFHSTSILIAVTVAFVGACGDGFDLPKPTKIEKISDGDGQHATAGNRLSVPFSVLAKASDESGVPRARVVWRVSEGNGAVLSDSVTLTDGNGLAQVYLTLGSTAGTDSVMASLQLVSDAAVTFTAVAVSAPEITSVDQMTFVGGDEITLRGIHFSDSTIFEIGGVEAAVSFVSVLGRVASVVVPQCLVPGAVSIGARVGISTPSTISATYAEPTEALSLAPGEYLSISPAALGGCATFPEPQGDTVEYLLAPQSVSPTPGESVAFRLRSDSAGTVVPLFASQPSDRSLTSRFDDFLRAQESELARQPREPQTEGPAEVSPIMFDISVGSRRTFRVCDKISCNAESDFASVQASARYVGNHAVIYQDLQAPAGGFNDEDLRELGSLFDDVLYDVATRAFGSESDVDRNGRLYILLTPVVNGLTETSECSQSYVTGFFFPLDIDPEAHRDERSNQAEVFYAIVPDPSGTVTCDHTVEKVARIVPVTFIHELQHMISFHQHVVVRAGNSEQTWLNEAMSHMAEELAALHFDGLGNQVRFTAFVLGDLYNAYRYLSDPSAHYVLYSDGTGTLEERGATWLFLRWLVDQYGEDLLRRLSETSLTGSENVMSATGAPLSELVADWFLANWVSSQSHRMDVPDRLDYETWDFRELYAQFHAQDPSLFSVPFPIEPTVFTEPTFDISGTLRAGSGAYYRMIQAPGQRGFTVELVDESGNSLGGDADPRLNVVRIR